LEAYEKVNLSEVEEKNFAKTKNAKAEFFRLTDEIITALKRGAPEDYENIYKLMNFGGWHVIAIDIQEGIAANIKYFQEVSTVNNAEQISERTHLTQLM